MYYCSTTLDESSPANQKKLIPDPGTMFFRNLAPSCIGGLHLRLEKVSATLDGRNLAPVDDM